MFIDQARIHVKAGSGGQGCNSFFWLKNGKRGKANGGHGGNGGDFIITASKHVNTLLDYHFNKRFHAEKGHNGGNNNKAGRNGKAHSILVPRGTVIKDDTNGLVLRDLVEDNESVVIARGGRGGHGNSRFREASPGQPGEEKDLLLELKLLADVGLIGFPNAGKSTLISKISSAKSKVADYPFTTKTPIIGMVRHNDEVLTFADMPGLIEGAHEGRGLGDRFLRHIERTRILLHLVDVSGFERPDPHADLLAIKKELELYDKTLLEKERIIVFSKIDMPGARERAEEIASKIDLPVFPISALTGEGIKDLLDYVFIHAVSL
jgi:GTP-binding protein